MGFTRFELSSVRGDDVLEPAAYHEAPNEVDRLGSWTEPCRGRVPAEVVAGDKTDLRDETVLDDEVAVTQAIAVSRVVEATLVAVVLAVPCGRLRVREVAGDNEVVIEGESAVDAIGLTGPVSEERRRAVREGSTDGAPA